MQKKNSTCCDLALVDIANGILLQPYIVCTLFSPPLYIKYKSGNVDMNDNVVFNTMQIVHFYVVNLIFI